MRPCGRTGSKEIMAAQEVEEIQEKRSYYAVIPSKLLTDAAITSTAKLVYAELSARADENGRCFPSNAYLAGLFHITIKQVKQHIAQLVETNYITTDVTDFNNRTITVLGGVTKRYRGSHQKVTGESPKGAYINNIDNKKKYIKKKTTQTLYPREYLNTIPEEDTLRLTGKYRVSKHQILAMADKMSLWLEKTGKSYKNYKAALEDWVARDYPRRDADGDMTIAELDRLRALQKKEASHAAS